MLVSIRPSQRFPVQCAVTNASGTCVKRLLSTQSRNTRPTATRRGDLTPISIGTRDKLFSQPQLIEHASIMAYCSRIEVASYTDRNSRIQLLRGSV